MYSYAGYNELGYLILIKETTIVITGATGSGLKRKRKTKKRDKTSTYLMTGTLAHKKVSNPIDLSANTAHSKYSDYSLYANTCKIVSSAYKYLIGTLCSFVTRDYDITGSGYTNNSQTSKLVASTSYTKEQDYNLLSVDSTDIVKDFELSAIGYSNNTYNILLKANPAKTTSKDFSMAWQSNIVALKDILFMEI